MREFGPGLLGLITLDSMVQLITLDEFAKYTKVAKETFSLYHGQEVMPALRAQP